LYSVIYIRISQSAQAWITQFYMQITPCLHFLRKRSPDGATLTEVADIQLQLTTHLSTPKGWKAENSQYISPEPSSTANLTTVILFTYNIPYNSL